jgi:PKD repeat protein
MKKLSFIALILITISCSKNEPATVNQPPTVDFSYSGANVPAPAAVSFTSTTTNTTSYLWDFGDNGSSTDANPVHTYIDGGVYTVKLTAKGNGGSTSTYKTVNIITTSNNPTVDFTYSGSNVPAPANVKFTSTTTNTTSYLWDFGDNGTSTAANPNHTYVNGGVYTVKLTAKGTSGSTSITKTVNIGAALTKVKIMNVTVTGMPFTSSNGSGWDPVDGPDVYYKITDFANTVLFNSTSSSRKNNITINSLPISWQLTTPFETTNLTDFRFIELWDYDTLDPDDYIGYAGFDFSSYKSSANPYPSTISSTNAGITITLDLIWY